MGYFSFANVAWIPRLKEIWKECFHDEDAYIDFFFANRFSPDRMVVWLEEEEPVAMACLFPCTCWSEMQGTRSSQKGIYIYAVATKPAYQGRGISSNLLHEILAMVQRDNAIGLLVPASEALINFYKKRNFYPSQVTKGIEYLEEAWLKVSSFMSESIVYEELETSQYKQIRDYHYMADGYVEWSLEELRYAIKENAFLGGFCRRVSWKGCNHAILGLVQGEELLLRETTLNPEEVKECATFLLEYFGCSKLLIRDRIFMSTEETWSEKGYFNLALD